MQSAGDHVWYDLRIHLHNGAKITAASGMEKARPNGLLLN